MIKKKNISQLPIYCSRNVIKRRNVVAGRVYEYDEVWEKGKSYRKNERSRPCTREEGIWADACAGMS